MIEKCFRFFIPQDLQPETALFEEMRFKAATLFTTGFISLMYIFLSLFVGFKVGLYTCIVFVLLHFVMLVSLRNRWLEGNTITHMFGVMTLFGLSLCSYHTGGYDSPILVWYSSTLVVSFWFSDYKTARLWIGIVLLILSMFFLGYALDYQFPVSLNDELFGFFKFSIGTGIFVYLMIVFISLQSWRMKALNELRELNQSKDRMMSIVAHDLKNPLMVMMGHIGLAKAGKPFNDKSLSLFESLNSRMKQIIDNMLIFERLQAGEYNFNRRELSVNEMMEQLIEEFRDQAVQKNIQLDFSNECLIKIHSDQLALERIISNIISNALKYTPSQKSVRVTVIPNGLKVQDEGIGLSDEVKSSLFQIYSKSGGKTQHVHDHSNGIGLYIVKHLSDQLGIKLEVESPGPDRGSTFTLLFS